MYSILLAAGMLLSTESVVTTNKTHHVIEEGETLTHVSKDYDVSLWEISYLNPQIEDLNKIHIGEKVAVSSESEIDLNSIEEEVFNEVTQKVKKAYSFSPVVTKKPITQTPAEATPVKVAPAKKDVVQNESFKQMSVEATAYTAYCAGCSGITKTGLNIRENPHLKVIAVDPNVIPLNSKVWVEGYGVAIAADTGGAIKGNKIDVFMPNLSDANEWGRKQVNIKVYN